MGTRINTNVGALWARNNVNRTMAAGMRNLIQLSTGLRINRAADSPVGIQVGQNLTARIASTEQAYRNVNEGINYSQVAEGGMSTIQDNLIRQRELAVQSANGTLSDEQRQVLDAEFQQLNEANQAIVDQTEYNGINPLQGETRQIQAGIEAGGANQVEVQTANFTPGQAGGPLQTMPLTQDIDTQAEAQTALGNIDTALQEVAEERGNIGAVQNRLEAGAENLQGGIVNMESSRSTIMDLDYARGITELTRNQIMGQAGMAGLAQANATTGLVLRLFGT